MPQPTPWYTIRAAAPHGSGDTRAEILIYGDIGESWWGESITAAQFVKDLAAIDASAITVRINSYGGSVTDGIAIHNAMRRHPAQIDVEIDGTAYSIASLIAMAGDTVRMADNALLMIHAPWTYADGNAIALREAADHLDDWATAMTGSYARKTGDADAMRALLTDGKDHFFTAAEAKAMGLVDEITDAMPLAAHAIARDAFARRLHPAPARATPAHPVSQPVSQPAAAAAQPQKVTMTAPTQDQAAATDAAVKAALAAEKQRASDIRARFAPFAARADVAALQRQCEDDQAITADAAGKRLLDLLAQDAAPVTPSGAAPRIETAHDETDKQREAATAALLARAGHASPDQIAALGANPYRGMSLRELARARLQARGTSTLGMGEQQYVAAAIRQGGSDFPVVLENVMHKVLQGSYAIASDTWRRFCAVGTVSDFRPHNRYRSGSIGNLDTVNELGEFTYKAIPDAEKASVQADTKGNVIALSRKAIVDDDLGYFTRMADMLGRSAARSIEADVYALLTANSGMGPTLGDTRTLFHSDHGNVASDAALSVAALDDMRVKMALQKDISGNDYLDLRPAVLVCSVAQGGAARVINGAQYDPDTANKLQRPNMVHGLFADIVDSARLSGTRLYAFADPAVAPVFEVSFLNGVQTPYLEFEQSIELNGSKWAVRIDYGVDVIDYRGAVTCKGST